ncbi:MAG: OmpA family protein [Bacteroidetes bacterium]|nr:OmpA family protein [Bacteroidota bacterium]
MQLRPFAALMLAAALLSAGILSAQTPAPATTGSTTTTKAKSNDPASLSWRKNKRTAKKLIKKGKIEAAVPYLEAGAGKKPKKVYFAENLSKIEYSLRDYVAANKWYKVLVDKDSAKHKKPAYIFEYARTQKNLGQYEDAKANFAKFKKLAGDDDASSELKKRATREAMGCDRGIFYRDSVTKRDFKVKHLDQSINQASSNFAPMAKDNALYFNSQKADHAIIYKSRKNGKSWSTADELAADINMAKANVTTPSFSVDGSTMYYTVCPDDNGAKIKPKCQIYSSHMVAGVWEKGAPLGALLNDGLSNNMAPAVGKNKDNEEVLYFVSDRNVGKGLDIFYSKLNPDGSVGKPHSVGSLINSRGDEMSPYYDATSKTLYFSSNGLINIGGYDVYKTTWDANGEWVDPENMGTPINSSVDDYYFSLNDKMTLGYLASNRLEPGMFKGGCATCTDDIFEVATTRLFLAVTGSVFEEKDGQRLPATEGSVLLYDDRNGTELGSYIPVDGKYFFDLQPKRGYKVLTRRDGYYDGVSTFNTDANTESDTLTYDLLQKKKEETNPLFGRVIGRIYYDYDQARLRADSRDSLRKIYDIMQQFPTYVFEVGAHTDGKGTEDYNLALSRRRADAAIGYFSYEKKISKDRLLPKAYGTSQPVAPNKTPDGKDDPKGRALNRRTEFKIVSELTPEQIAADEAKNSKNKKAAPAKETTRTIAPAKGTSQAPVPVKETSTTAAPKKMAVAAAKAKDEKVARVVKKDVVFSKPEPKAETKTETAVYKTAPSESVTLKGTIYTVKGNNRQLAGEAAVFLTSDIEGFQQKVSYVKGDGSYYFDLTRATPGIYKIVARKGNFESNEISMSLEHIKQVKAPIDLEIPVK